MLRKSSVHQRLSRLRIDRNMLKIAALRYLGLRKGKTLAKTCCQPHVTDNLTPKD